MPNNISNKLVVTSSNSNEIEQFLNRIKGNNQGEVIDFNAIIPMPFLLENTEESGNINESVYYYLTHSGKEEIVSKVLSSMYVYMLKKKSFDKYSDEDLQNLYSTGEKYYNNFLKTGSINWYDWRYKHWNTKWNAYESSYSSDSETKITMFFQTAWRGVPCIIKKLVSMFPNLEFDYKYSDEDMTYNCGIGKGDKNGFKFTEVEDASDEAMLVYIECWNEDEEEFVKQNGRWHRKDSLEEDEE